MSFIFSTTIKFSNYKNLLIKFLVYMKVLISVKKKKKKHSLYLFLDFSHMISPLVNSFIRCQNFLNIREIYGNWIIIIFAISKSWVFSSLSPLMKVTCKPFMNSLLLFFGSASLFDTHYFPAWVQNSQMTFLLKIHVLY